MEKVNFSNLVQNIVPEYIRIEFPLVIEFLKQYYKSQESSGQPLDLIQSLKTYVDVDKITNLVDSTTLYSDVGFFDSDIFVRTTYGFPSRNGLIQINSEVIFYDSAIDESPVEFLGSIDVGFNEIASTQVIDLNSYVGWLVLIKNSKGELVSKRKIVGVTGGERLLLDQIPITSTNAEGYDPTDLYNCEIVRSKFTGCRRGFCGITGLKQTNSPDKLIFESTKSGSHRDGTVVKNLNILIFKEFFRKLKVQVAPGFEDGEFYKDLNESVFIKNIKQFYSSKGSECSFELLFRALFGKDIEIVIPSKYLIEPSSSRYSITRNVVVELIEGKVEDLENRTLYQDQHFNIPAAKGLITRVQKLQVTGKSYYKLYLDESVESNYDSTYGNFRIHPKTKNTTKINRGQNFIDVDSTIGFPNKGTLVLKNNIGIEYRVEYNSKTSTQFLNCSILEDVFEESTDISLDVFAYVKTRSGIVKVKITGVIDTDIPLSKVSKSKLLKKNDKFIYKTLGVHFKNDERVNNWIYNIPLEYDVKSLSLINEKDFTYKVETHDKHNFSVGQSIKIEPDLKTLENYDGIVVEYNNEYTITVRGSKIVLPENINYVIKKLVNKSNFSELLNYPSDVQNTYVDKSDNSVYVNSQSIPLYKPSFEVGNFNVNRRIVTFSGNFKSQDTIEIGKHGFYTGDAVVYKPSKTVYVPKYVLGANGTRSYNFIDPETNESQANPTLFLIRGRTYRFVNLMGEHPFRIQISQNGLEYPGEQYNDGITNNDVSNGVLIWDVLESTPDVLYYQCTSHQGMGGVINIIDPDQQSSLNINKGIYFVEKVSSTSIKLYSSRSNIYTGENIKLSGKVNNDTFEFADFTNKQLETRNIGPQDILRKIIAHPQHEHGNNKQHTKLTDPGTIGIFRNGVELLNYKSKDTFKYGAIEHISVTSKGMGYDVINPPNIQIADAVGFGATAICAVNGYLKKIDVIDKGFNYIDTPKISISGGNGSGASAEPVMESYTHSSVFDSKSVNVSTDTIGFSTYHKFSNGEEVIYDSQGQTSITGITTSTRYFVSIVDAKNIKLHNTKKDAVNNTNPVDLTVTGVGYHKFICVSPKRRVKSVLVTSFGGGYENKLRICNSSGISTFRNVVMIKNHGYNDGEIITYNPTVSPVSGLSSATNYYVLKVNDNSFRLCNVGVTTEKDIFYRKKDFIKFSGNITGEHKFNYPKIEVTISGRSGLTTSELNDYTGAVLQPVFVGEIDSVFVKNGGFSYGSQILNFDSQPNINIQQGRNARLRPIVKDGKIVSVIIENPGLEYYSIPELTVIGLGKDAKLIPIIRDRSLYEVVIANPGTGYNSNTKIIVSNSGKNADLYANISEWRVDLVNRYSNSDLISEEDSFVYEGRIRSIGLQYVHTYAPRKLRQISLGKRFVNGEEVFNQDLELIDGIESNSLSHSPILGWSYDGNPIYGPYGYSSQTGGRVVHMKSGYSLKSNISRNLNRPSIEKYPPGFFVEDYEFTGNGDLDIHNGRFCITPEYPNGVYAYFCTINDAIDVDGPFKNFKRPVFPYVIGNTYVSKPVEFNFKLDSNLRDFDINSSNLLRNVNSYSFNQNNTRYPFLKYLKSDRKENAVVKSTSFGEVDNVGIVTGGDGYKVGDRIVFDGQLTEYKAKARVSKVRGKEVTNVSFATTSLITASIVRDGSSYVGYTSLPHRYRDSEVLTLSYKDNLLKTDSISVTYNVLTLKKTIGLSTSTGVICYIPVSGSLDNIIPDDVYYSGIERFKILKVEKNNSRILVQRAYGGSISTSHTLNAAVTEEPRRFTFNPGNVSITTSYTNKLAKPVYIKPSESVGLGTTAGVGIGYTLSISDPGIGATQISIPTRSIYIPKHNFVTGDALKYTTEGGTSIGVSTDGISSYSLDIFEEIYVSRITDDLIGVTTSLSGITTSPQLLYFTSSGIGTVHKFVPNYSNQLICDLVNSSTIVSTSSTHGLTIGDVVDLEVVSGLTTTYKITYDKDTRRVIVGRRDFDSSDVNVSENYITIPDHKLSDGQLIVYKSNSPSIGLNNNELYNVTVINRDRIKLANNYYDAVRNINSIEIGSSSSGSILPVNPPIEVVKYSTLKFDLSDSSLSFNRGPNQKESAFKFKLYYDHHLTHEFYSSKLNGTFNLSLNGTVGVSSDASATIRVGDDLPNELFYNIVPIKTTGNPKENLELFVDMSAKANGNHHNSIVLVNSGFNGTYKIIDVTPKTFTIPLLSSPERNSYVSNDLTKINYYSRNTGILDNISGPISEIEIQSRGKGYKSIPKILEVVTGVGTGAILKVDSNNIGKVSNITVDDIGIDYYSDRTLRPTFKSPTLLELDYKSSIESIDVIKPGKNYSIPPDIVIIDGFTNKVINDFDFSYNPTTRKVSILKNTYDLSEYDPKIIFTNNSNGVGISTLSYNPTNKHVTITLDAQYSSFSKYPFTIGSKILVENVSVGVATTGRGYNSENYNYTLFNIVDLDANIGGVGGTITYSLDGLIGDNEIPGNFDSFNSAGRVIPEAYFPEFKINSIKNKFLTQETIQTKSGSIGKIESIDYHRDIIKVSSVDEFKVGDTVKGLSSGREATVRSVVSSEVDLNISATSLVRNGWDTRKGFLNDDQQRIHDSDYYQYFSYAVKSEVDFETWNPYVSNLTHTVGFKKFSDLIATSQPNYYTGISTTQNSGSISGISDIYESVDLDCYQDFDLVSESISFINQKEKSKTIQFNTKLLQDYIESKGNRVLVIDDISNLFNRTPRPTRYSTIDSYSKNISFSKYFTFIGDIDNPRYRQSSLLSFLSDGSSIFGNEYAKVFPDDSHLGSFDARIIGDNCVVEFYPTEFRFSNYEIHFVSLQIDPTISGIGTINFGDVSKIYSTQSTSVGIGSTTIAIIPTDYTSSKMLIQIQDDLDYFQINELLLTTDGNDVYLNSYGDLNSSVIGSFVNLGIGTISAYVDGSDVVVYADIDSPNSNSFEINSSIVSIASTGSTGIGSTTITGSFIQSSYVSIASTASPYQVEVSKLDSRSKSAYIIASVEDLTNGGHYACELVLLSKYNNTDSYFVEFGHTGNDYNIGEFGTSADGTSCKLTFTPRENCNVEVRCVQIEVSMYDESISPSESIDLHNNLIIGGMGEYVGTDLAIRSSFDLEHKGNPIFRKKFDPTAVGIISVTDNTIKVPNHFFVTGEELKYEYDSSTINSTNALSIGSTDIPGIGYTDKMPHSVYAVKVNDTTIQVSASASDALAFNPKVLDIQAIGISTQHYFTSKKQNTKALITIDNIIQTPLVSTSTTSSLVYGVDQFDPVLEFTSIENFAGGDLIKIGNEIMRILSIGIESNPNLLLVKRAFVGSKRENHPIGSLITKAKGQYNIIDNVIYFREAPYGNVEFSNPLDKPDEVDYFGLDLKSTFSGRVFLRSGIEGSLNETYDKNYLIDSISEQFTGYEDNFTIKSETNNVTGIATGNSIILINNVLQVPQRDSPIFVEGNYEMSEHVGVTSIRFTGFSTEKYYDINLSGYPRGGIILSIGSSQGLGYQPLVSAGGTAVISGLGTISSVSIGNSGSGYRSGIQTSIRIGVKTESISSNIDYIGFATAYNGSIVSIAITNPGVGYTNTNPPIVIFDAPLPYNKIPLQYKYPTSGLGTESYVDIVVGQDSKVSTFNFVNYGYGFSLRDVLTIPVGGTTGIPTDTSYSFEPFEIVVDSIYDDDFSGWRFGDFIVIDPIDDLVDGFRRFFPIRIDGQQTTIRSRPGSAIDIQATLIVTVNDIIQVPGEGFIFKNGSVIEFAEAPSPEDKVSILFYKGTGTVDTTFVDLIEPVELGDTLVIESNDSQYLQNPRVAAAIVNTDTLETNAYPGPGLDLTESLRRPVKLCKQRFDTSVNGQYVGKSRSEYEPYFRPVTQIIKPIDQNSTEIFVEGVKIFFDDASEYVQNGEDNIPQKSIIILSQDNFVGASATAVVSVGGTISEVVITNGGVGYSTNPIVSIPNPIGIGYTLKSLFNITQTQLDSTISIGGTVSSISVVSSGTGYTSTNPPIVIIESPSVISEEIVNVTYEGDFGIITGISTVSVGVASTGLRFDLFVPLDSFIRDTSVSSVGIATTGISGIQTNYYFVVNHSNIGTGVTSLDSSGNIISIGNTFIDNVYEAVSVSIGQTEVAGVGITYVAQVVVSIDSFDGIDLVGLGYSGFYGEYSWGKIGNLGRRNPRSFGIYNNGLTGINTSPIVIRKNRLGYLNYL